MKKFFPDLGSRLIQLFFRFGMESKSLVKTIFLVLLFFWGTRFVIAQELNAEVKVIGKGVGITDRQLLTGLQESLRNFINGRRWSDEIPERIRRIDSSFTLVITGMDASGVLSGEMYVQSFFKTDDQHNSFLMLNLRDTGMEFDYTPGQSLSFDPYFLQDNLTATVAYYVYLIIGLDADARKKSGGTSSFRTMEQIAASAQAQGWKGWNPREAAERSSISAALNDGTFEDYRLMWRVYHDSNTLPAERVRVAVDYLTELQSQRPGSVLLRLFGDSKLQEMIVGLSSESETERAGACESLLRLYPSRSEDLKSLR